MKFRLIVFYALVVFAATSSASDPTTEAIIRLKEDRGSAILKENEKLIGSLQEELKKAIGPDFATKRERLKGEIAQLQEENQRLKREGDWRALLPKTADELRLYLIGTRWDANDGKNPYEFMENGRFQSRTRSPQWVVVTPRRIVVFWSEDARIDCVLDDDCTMLQELGGARTLFKRVGIFPPGPKAKVALVDLMPEYPKPLFMSEMPPALPIPNLEKPDPDAPKGPQTLRVPKGTMNVAKGRKVFGSDLLPIVGTLDLITDGVADGSEGCYVELAPGPQWVRIDLEADYDIWKILLWHYHRRLAVFFGVVVQVSDDPQFKNGVTTLFNNDVEGRNDLGKGTDKNYIETNYGRLIEGKGTKARYVRLWSNGNSLDEMNRYVEVQVFGTRSE